MKAVSRHHPLLVALHWLIALMILGMLAIGFLVLAPMNNTDPAKTDILLIHMAVGMTILALMIVRFIVRLASSRPPDAKTGTALFDRLGPITHYAFYVVVVLMVASGFTTAILAGLDVIVFQRSGEPLPASFGQFPSFRAHFLLALLLMALIALHFAAALYHQFFLKDRLFGRMWFGRRG